MVYSVIFKNFVLKIVHLVKNDSFCQNLLKIPVKKTIVFIKKKRKEVVVAEISRDLKI